MTTEKVETDCIYSRPESSQVFERIITMPTLKGLGWKTRGVGGRADEDDAGLVAGVDEFRVSDSGP